MISLKANALALISLFYRLRIYFTVLRRRKRMETTVKRRLIITIYYSNIKEFPLLERISRSFPIAIAPFAYKSNCQSLSSYNRRVTFLSARLIHSLFLKFTINKHFSLFLSIFLSFIPLVVNISPFLDLKVVGTYFHGLSFNYAFKDYFLDS